MVQIFDLKPVLDRLYAEFNYPESAADPIHTVRRYAASEDREVVAFVAASLAFGRVASVLQSIERVLAIMGPRPADYVRAFEPERDAAAFAGVVHRWTRGPDLVALLWVMRQMIDRAGSIERFFLEGHEASGENVARALDSFSTRALKLDLKSAYGRVPKRPGVCYFFPRPSAGSGCKRLNLFLRWIDTHVIRVGRCLRLTRYTSPGWRMAVDITASLRRLDPDDPVKYDFALCHIGMMNACGFNRAEADSNSGGKGPPDAHCPLRGLCRPRVRTPRPSRRPSARR
ncbi:MAG: TIGR02757 family protein [Acidobacteria bacterium]|nr:MAG: TIGR02757 family protein [Acidobacteriota bacterium]